MTAEYFDMTPEQEAAWERADQRGDSNAHMARIAVGAYPISEIAQTTFTPEKNQLPGKPVSYNKPSGHVQDFNGRSDEHRGGMVPPQTPGAIDAYLDALPVITELNDDLKKSELLKKVADGSLTPVEAQARWMAFLHKRGR